MLLSGYLRRSSLMTDLPTTWFGRQANGCVHTTFGQPLRISSTISAVRSQPSPIELHSDRISLAYSASS